MEVRNQKAKATTNFTNLFEEAQVEEIKQQNITERDFTGSSKSLESEPIDLSLQVKTNIAASSCYNTTSWHKENKDYLKSFILNLIYSRIEKQERTDAGIEQNYMVDSANLKLLIS